MSEALLEAAAQAPVGGAPARIPAGRLALVGNPNCGKTALFNALTGARQKVANYAGVTVERKEGTFTTPGGRASTPISPTCSNRGSTVDF